MVKKVAKRTLVQVGVVVLGALGVVGGRKTLLLLKNWFEVHIKMKR